MYFKHPRHEKQRAICSSISQRFPVSDERSGAIHVHPEYCIFCVHDTVQPVSEFMARSSRVKVFGPLLARFRNRLRGRKVRLPGDSTDRMILSCSARAHSIALRALAFRRERSPGRGDRTRVFQHVLPTYETVEHSRQFSLINILLDFSLAYF